MKPPPRFEEVIGRLDYDPDTGLFIWKAKPEITFHDKAWNSRHAGNIAGNLTREGYIVIRINGRNCYAQQVAWIHHFGVWPETQIDHKDRDKANNIIRNLRLATPKQNAGNTELPSTNTSGLKGVSLYARTGRYRACITVGRKQKHLGYFDSEAEAAAAYIAAARSHFGEFAYAA
ncbi:HNH endonuclease [Tardiphaga sp.]|uniref:HNH endonuclease n=1 Tax=Tardiphaga sp. TaxID=1926292 RepID=UPI002624CBDF|nr:HNH endonuclease [Tardiphaga sp.]MDB5618221.1 hypothetical protein [Tardiphaga sp.]